MSKRINKLKKHLSQWIPHLSTQIHKPTKSELLDYAYQIVEKRIELDPGEGVVHVKDGKPLTAHGAKLLGVPWNA